MPKLNKNSIVLGIAVLAILVTGVLIFANSSYGDKLSFLRFNSGESPAAIAKKSIDYLNKNVLQQGQTATLGAVSEESGVIKMNVKIGTNSYDSYVTKDGKLFFPEAFALDAKPAGQATTQQPTQNTADVAKVDKTMLEAYVVSDCPYGLQTQRAMADAIKSVPSLAQYITVRYIGAVTGKTISSMHGQEEADENLRQICIRDEQQSKYWAYVSCYMKNAAGTMANGMPYGDTKSCQTAAGIDSNKLNGCVSTPSRGVAYAKEDFDLSTKYNVTGSPTLILNGTTISETPFGGRSADAFRNIVCSSSKTAPSFCTEKLNTDQASTSFAVSYAPAGGSATASSSAANCAPTAQ